MSIEDALALNHTSLCTMCVRKSIYLATNGPDIRNGEDKAIIPELIVHSKCIVVSEKCPYNYLYREGSASIVANMNVVESLIKSWNYIDKILFEWRKKGIKTRQDVNKNNKEFSERKKSSEEVFDYDWLNE